MKLREFWFAFKFGPDENSGQNTYVALHKLEHRPDVIHVIEAAPALAALHAAEQALTAAVHVIDQRSPSWSDIDAALKLVRETLGVGPRWLDKPK
jgi:hypothetical protein